MFQSDFPVGTSSKWVNIKGLQHSLEVKTVSNVRKHAKEAELHFNQTKRESLKSDYDFLCSEMDLALDRAFEVRSKIDTLEKELCNFVSEIKSLENIAHNIRAKVLILGVNADDIAKRKTFDISKLLPSMPTPQVTPTLQVMSTLQVTSTPQVMSTPQPILVIVLKPSTISKPPPLSSTIELDLDQENSDMEETMQTTNNVLLEKNYGPYGNYTAINTCSKSNYSRSCFPTSWDIWPNTYHHNPTKKYWDQVGSGFKRRTLF